MVFAMGCMGVRVYMCLLFPHFISMQNSDVQSGKNEKMTPEQKEERDQRRYAELIRVDWLPKQQMLNSTKEIAIPKISVPSVEQNSKHRAVVQKVGEE
jgi:hypothetical protein